MTRSPAPPPSRAPTKRWAKALFSIGIAGVALAFVAYVVPVRDTCVDPETGTRMSRVETGPVGSAEGSGERPGGCSLARRGEVVRRLSSAECSALACEPGLGSTFRGTSPSWLAAMAALYFLGTFAWAVRWRELLGLAMTEKSKAPGPLFVWRITLEAQAGGILLPGGVAGDALRIGSMVGRGIPLSVVVASTLLDRALGLVTLAMVAAALALGAGDRAIDGRVLAVLAACPLGLGVGLIILRSPPMSRWLSEGPLAKYARDAAAYIASDRAPRAILRAFVVSLVVSATQLLVLRGLVHALGAVPVEPRWVYLGTAMAFMVAALPVLPGGWGTSDVAFVFFFAFAGLRPQVALGACLLYRAFWYLSGIVGALLRLLSAVRTPPS